MHALTNLSVWLRACNAQCLWASMQGCRKPVGLVLMTQELVAGIGNIYRAEILYKVGESGAWQMPRPQTCLGY